MPFLTNSEIDCIFKEAASRKVDAYRLLASKIWDTDYDKVTDVMRKRAKDLSFAYIYSSRQVPKLLRQVADV